jgi:uncharacterized Ntn-hydrolase superfamily protein
MRKSFTAVTAWGGRAPCGSAIWPTTSTPGGVCSLCVGGWVLRGDARAGVSASQGYCPSTLWGEEAIAALGAGETAKAAVARIVAADPGRGQRQLAALGLSGPGAAFTGAANVAATAERAFAGGIATGNMLAGPAVIDALVAAYLGASGTFALRLMAGLRAAAASGGDSRGLLSAALLILARDRPPVTLRVDWSLTPLDALEELHMRATRGPYAGWSADVPTLDAPHRTCGGTGGDDSGDGDWWSRGGSNP